MPEKVDKENNQTMHGWTDLYYFFESSFCPFVSSFFSTTHALTLHPRVGMESLFWESIHIKSEQKKPDTFKNWPMIKNPQFSSHETWWKLLPHEVIIFTKFHEDRTKIKNFLLMANFWKCLVFFSSDFIRHLISSQNNPISIVFI